MTISGPTILQRDRGIPWGMATPREMIDEWMAAERKKRGQEFLVRRLKQIRRHLGECKLPGHAISLLDMPLKEPEFRAVIDEAWKVVKTKDEIKEIIRKMADEGRA